MKHLVGYIDLLNCRQHLEGRIPFFPSVSVSQRLIHFSGRQLYNRHPPERPSLPSLHQPLADEDTILFLENKMLVCVLCVLYVLYVRYCVRVREERDREKERERDREREREKEKEKERERERERKREREREKETERERD